MGGRPYQEWWSGNGRIEVRNASLGNQKTPRRAGMQRNLEKRRSMAVGYTMRQTDSPLVNTRNSDLRLSFAIAQMIPANGSGWTVPTTSHNRKPPPATSRATSWCNNHYWMPSRHTQVSLQYGSKYVLDTIDNTDYSGYTDLIGAEVRHDLNEDWDVGVFGSVMRSVNAGVRSYGVGASLGYKPMENMWVSGGYNLRGTDDRDFADNAAYRAKGPFITLRMKVDQDSLGLNNGGERSRPLSGE